MEKEMSDKYPLTYAVKHKDMKVRMASRSGGFFTALSNLILDHGGAVYGCVLTDEFEAIHMRADDRETRDRMCGSKYVQSRMEDVFSEVKKDLDDGKWVLFTGTPCQIAGLKGFLGRYYDNLILVDIFCHGVPSPNIWNRYLEWQESKNGRCTAVDFRNKRDYGWSDHVETLEFGDKTVSSQIYTFLFYGDRALRPCCYECPFRSLKRVGNVSMGDYWEIDRACPGFNDDKGVSLVFVNDAKGADIFDAVKDDLEWRCTRLEDSVRPSMLRSPEEPDDRDLFWRDVLHTPFGVVVRKYVDPDLMFRFLRKIGKALKHVCPPTAYEPERYVNSGNDDGHLPVLYMNRKYCCGCSACYASCPAHAIAMRPDNEGFLYPVVDAGKCTRCRRCISVCFFKNKAEVLEDTQSWRK